MSFFVFLILALDHLWWFFKRSVYGILLKNKWPQIEKKWRKTMFNLHIFNTNEASLPHPKNQTFKPKPNPSLRPNEVLDCIQVLFQSITRPLDFDDTRIWQKMMKMDDRGNASSFDWLYRNWKPLKTYSPTIPKCIFQNF